MALPSRAVQDPAALLVPWINHHGTYTIAELRAANIAIPKLKNANARRLFSCWLDFSLVPAHLESALAKPPNSNRPASPSGITEEEPSALSQSVRPLEASSPSASSTTSGQAPGWSSTVSAGASEAPVLASHAESATSTTAPLLRTPRRQWTTDSLAPPAPWQISAARTSESSTRQPPVKLKVVTKSSKAGTSTAESTPTLTLAQPSSALLSDAAATSTPLSTSQQRPGSASSTSTSSLPVDANNSATESAGPQTRARTRGSPARTPCSSPILPRK